MTNGYMKWLCEMFTRTGHMEIYVQLYEMIMKMDKQNKYKYMEYNLC